MARTQGDAPEDGTGRVAVAALAKTAPALLPRSFDGIADRRPPYASEDENAGQR
ncbi:hypothetical protein ACIG53_15240 [Streptomyces bauhiniae]|uniref:hypothetical protein n=1 Tax=Streptomyces bauhiniae TaxID=2340725 RepID=UPI0037D1EDA5